MVFSSTFSPLILATISAIVSSNDASYKAIIDSESLVAMEGMTMSLELSDQDDSITISLTGPSSVYYSIAVGSCIMSGTWSLVIPGLTASAGSTPFEQLLGSHAGGSSLDDSFEVVDDTVDGLLRTVTFTRSLSADLTDDYYAFTTDDEEIVVQWAYGSSADFSNHGEYQRDCTTLSFTKILQTEEETANAPTLQLFSLLGKWSESTGSLIVILALFGMVLLYAVYLKYCKSAKNRMSHDLEEMQSLISLKPSGGEYDSVCI